MLRPELRQPVRIGLGLLIGLSIGFALAYSPWVIVALVGLTVAYFVFVRRS
jgi:hypothetical protein